MIGVELPAGKDSLNQEFELPGFAKEASFIGGDGVDHPGAFALILRCGNAFVVTFQGIDIQGPQPPEEPSA